MQIPASFRAPGEPQQAESQATSFADLPWWQVFHDPQLQELIRTALKQNYDLQLAVERVTAARAQVGITRSNQFPQVSADPDFSGAKTDQGIKSNIFSLAADVVFQLDFFGRYRRATEAARAQLLGTEDAQQTVILTLVSDVASDYFLLRDLDLQLQITQETVETQEDSVKLTEMRLESRCWHEAGRASVPASARYRQCADPGPGAANRPDRGRDQHPFGKLSARRASREDAWRRDPERLGVERGSAAAIACGAAVVAARAQAGHPRGRAEPRRRQR